MVTDSRVLSKSVHVSKKHSLSQNASIRRIQSLYFQHVVSLRWVTQCCRAPRCPRCLPTILHCSRRGRGFLAAAAATLCGDATCSEFTSDQRRVFPSCVVSQLDVSYLRLSLLGWKLWKFCLADAWMGTKPCLLSFSGDESACRQEVMSAGLTDRKDPLELSQS